jgi:hypothetical protein
MMEFVVSGLNRLLVYPLRKPGTKVQSVEL